MNGIQGSWSPEPSEAETEASNALSLQVRRELSPEEQDRLEYLQNQLQSLLQDLAEQPSEQNKGRIREIEAEIEKLTGIKSQSSLTKMAAQLPSQKDEKTEDDKNSTIIHPKTLEETIASHTLPEGGNGPAPDVPGPGLMPQMLRAAGSYQATAKNLSTLLTTQGTSLGSA